MTVSEAVAAAAKRASEQLTFLKQAAERQAAEKKAAEMKAQASVEKKA